MTEQRFSLAASSRFVAGAAPVVLPPPPPTAAQIAERKAAAQQREQDEKLAAILLAQNAERAARDLEADVEENGPELKYAPSDERNLLEFVQDDGLYGAAHRHNRAVRHRLDIIERDRLQRERAARFKRAWRRYV
jgi:hypothetical protein